MISIKQDVLSVQRDPECVLYEIKTITGNKHCFWVLGTQLTLWSDTSMVLQVILETVSQEKF